MSTFNDNRLMNYLENSSEFNTDDRSQSYRFRCPENARHSYYFCQDNKCVYCVECDSDYNIVDCVRVKFLVENSSRVVLEHMPHEFKDIPVFPEQLPLYRTISPYFLSAIFILWWCLVIFFIGSSVYAKTNRLEFNPFINNMLFLGVKLSAFNVFSFCLMLISGFLKKCYISNRAYKTIWSISFVVFIASIIVSIVMCYM